MLEQLVTTLAAVFLAELGDKTQLATFSFAADPNYNMWVVLVGSCSALVVISAVAVLAGSLVGSLVEPRYYETDPLTCPKCHGEMKIISFIDQPDLT